MGAGCAMSPTAATPPPSSVAGVSGGGKTTTGGGSTDSLVAEISKLVDDISSLVSKLQASIGASGVAGDSGPGSSSSPSTSTTAGGPGRGGCGCGGGMEGAATLQASSKSKGKGGGKSDAGVGGAAGTAGAANLAGAPGGSVTQTGLPSELTKHPKDTSHEGLTAATKRPLAAAHQHDLWLISGKRPQRDGHHSFHTHGNAIDVANVPGGSSTGSPEMDAYAEHMRQAAKAGQAPEIEQIIYKDQIATSRDGWAWRPFTPAAGRSSSPTERHLDHVHISVK